MFKWSNQYFVGQVCEAISGSGALRVMAVQSGNVSSLYLVNIGANPVTFNLANYTGPWNDNNTLIKIILFIHHLSFFLPSFLSFCKDYN